VRDNVFVDMAIRTHQRQLNGNIPIEIKTNSPAVVTAWFTGKVPFPFRLPEYRKSSQEQVKYRLSGGRLVGFQGDYAAFLPYKMNGQLISLLIASAPSCKFYRRRNCGCTKYRFPFASKEWFSSSDLVRPRAHLCPRI
jgi:hypothetical protein